MPQQTPAGPEYHGDAEPIRVLMDQGHARLHYGVPLAMHRAGVLALAFCDYFRFGDAFDAAANRALRLFSPALADKMHDRHTPDLPPEKVYAERAWTLYRHVKQRALRESAGDFWEAWTRHRAKAIGRHLHLGNALHGYVTSLHPPLLQRANAAGILCSGDQIIAPVIEQQRQAELQLERFPGYAKDHRTADLSRFRDLEQATWPQLAAVTCPADYVKRLLIEAGVEEQRISVLPYPFDVAHVERDRPAKSQGPIVVGFVGAVNLRKGAPYFIEVAKRLAGPHFAFRMIGPVGISEAARRDAEPHVDFRGSVPRSRVKQELREMDIFFFPSTCEGSAGVLYEAASMALPIVTSPNSGTHNRAPDEAVILPYDDTDAACEALAQLADDAGRRRSLGLAACEALSRCSLDAYAQNIRRVYVEAFAKRAGGGPAPGGAA